ncbi:PTS sugar transporter subunit IIA [Gottfriedia solisilvae]|uniref:Mannitol-specific phosphotransferase enzyme IIA component n=1 Tax=Gottfriedia solisilvae TaxID=1516104 RepID=A0A8J3ANK6_9BACI|nr:PTS sugar transporter subunit IIA [Gottfriedia solisilvae]GGI13946.1 mannitol-specific phosphotransferase enzyme IIA component [Gottfriedia solisilvae]
MIQTVLPTDNILLNVEAKTSEEAIRLAGSVLVKNGYVEETYIEKMIEREQSLTTYMGNYIAIPHGTEESKEEVITSGISVLQIPNGVEFGNGNIVKVVFGIAGKNNEHLDLLSQIAILCSEEENVHKLIAASSKEELINMFSEVE